MGQGEKGKWRWFRHIHTYIHTLAVQTHSYRQVEFVGGTSRGLPVSSHRGTPHLSTCKAKIMKTLKINRLQCNLTCYIHLKQTLSYFFSMYIAEKYTVHTQAHTHKEVLLLIWMWPIAFGSLTTTVISYVV